MFVAEIYCINIKAPEERHVLREKNKLTIK